MTSQRQGEAGDEAAPLVLPVADEILQVRPIKNYARDVHILSIAFLFVFSAYGAAQNLESTVNNKGGLGTTSLGILYTSFTLFSVVSSQVVRWLGSKTALVSYMGAYTMVPASLFLGFTASVIWVGQGTYLTSAALSHAKDYQLHVGTVIGNFNGKFWGIFAGYQIIGNLFSLVLLNGGEKEGDVTGENLLFTIFLVCMIVGIVLMGLLSRGDDKGRDLVAHFSLGSIIKSITAPLLDARMLLIIPLIAYSGLQQAFVWAEFTKEVVTPALGISGVGGAMAVYGAADAICALVAGRLTSGLSSITPIVVTGAFNQMFVLFWLCLGFSPSGGFRGHIYPLIMAAMWGIGYGVLNTQLNALLGILFKNDKEAAFAQLKMWQCGAVAVIFFVSPYITLEAMVVVMIPALFIAVLAFLYLTLCVERSFAPGA